MATLRFASINEALQHLSDTTGKKVVVLAGVNEDLDKTLYLFKQNRPAWEGWVFRGGVKLNTQKYQLKWSIPHDPSAEIITTFKRLPDEIKIESYISDSSGYSQDNSVSISLNLIDPKKIWNNIFHSMTELAQDYNRSQTRPSGNSTD